ASARASTYRWPSPSRSARPWTGGEIAAWAATSMGTSRRRFARAFTGWRLALNGRNDPRADSAAGLGRARRLGQRRARPPGASLLREGARPQCAFHPDLREQGLSPDADQRRPIALQEAGHDPLRLREAGSQIL